MKTAKFLIVMFVLLIVSGSAAQAQFSRRLGNAVKRAAEDATVRKAEQKTDQAVSKSIDKATDPGTYKDKDGDNNKAKSGEKKPAEAENREKAENAGAVETEAAPDVEIPQVSDTPYTPGEAEWAFFAMKAGSVQVFATKNGKGKVTGQTRNTVKQIVGAKDAFAIEYQSELLDEKGQPLTNGNKQPMVFNYRIVVSGDVMYLDLKSLFGAIDGLEGMQANGTAMKIPNKLSVGQTLPDASAKVKIGFINCTAVMTEGKVMAAEDVGTAAGTFKCYKVSQKVNSSVMGIKTEGTTLTWYAKGVGAVKTETIDKKGKVIQTQEIVSNN